MQKSQEMFCALRRIVVDDLSEYVPNDDKQALDAAIQFALEHEIWLPPNDIRRIARVTQNPNAILKQLVHAEDVPADDISAILTSLGRPYDKMREGPGIEFDIPANIDSIRLFERLQSAGRVKIIRNSAGNNVRIKNL